MATNLRGVVVGASTLVGKELIEELNASANAWDLRLTDTIDSAGQLIAGTDEALLIQPLSPELFDARDFAFFAADPKTTRAHWREAQAAGAVVIDLTAALENEPGATVRCPWLPNTGGPVETPIVIPAHPAAVMLALVASRLRSAFSNVHLAATVLEPASQQGSRGLDEMHQQTVSLLGLHSLPQEIYDAQVAFNLRVSVGEDAKLDMGEIATTIRRHLRAISDEATTAYVALQLVQAPVFHGYTMSVYAQLPANADSAAVRKALHADLITVTNADDAPSNQSVMQEPGITIAVSAERTDRADARGYWLWIAADNLKLAAREAASCAEERVKSRAVRETQ